jgi:tetratricopeptide (TPR) repeat protein
VGDAFEAERLGSLFAGVGNHEKALGYFERAVKNDPRDPRSCLFLGLYYRAGGRDEESTALLARAPAGSFDQAEVNLIAGDIHLWADRPNDALDYFQRAVDLDGLNPVNARRLARAAMLAGRYEAAENTLRWMVEQDRSALEAWNSLGMVMLRQGRQQDAARFFRTSLDIHPDQPEVRRLLDSLPTE